MRQHSNTYLHSKNNYCCLQRRTGFWFTLKLMVVDICNWPNTPNPLVSVLLRTFFIFKELNLSSRHGNETLSGRFSLRFSQIRIMDKGHLLLSAKCIKNFILNTSSFRRSYLLYNNINNNKFLPNTIRHLIY